MANINKFKELFPRITSFGRSEFEFLGVQEFGYEEKESGGWSGAPLLKLLNFAISECLAEGEQYLEIGTYCGRSLIGALKNNNAYAQVIDNFWEGNSVWNAWNNTIDKFNIRDRIILHKMACEEFNDNLPKIGVFFYDGNHDSGHTYEGLKKFKPYLADKAIIIVDDYKILGGNAQKVFPGHSLDINYPVRTDTDRWLLENKEANLIAITPWGQKQAIIIYEKI